ncbi:MAG TPA: DNA polymerase III subunit gamma/tau, partial [Methanobacteriaceae archaeon]|nr:DNA polymerase III subunit gamma/tau [Methanobacteriaceae archaeon]
MTQYQSIYRKWRPQSFEDIVGQNHITQTLKNAIKMNRIAHAYLFSGPRGVGKTTTARIFAKALNCEKGPTETPCGQCSRCIRISQGQSLDVLEIDGASNRGIEEIRELRSKIGFAPAEGKYKIYIIDEVHMLTDPAFNALLKTLEEPPSQVLFIFATTAPYKVPNTILSRCQSFNFRRISIEEMVEKLKKITDEEKINIDSSSLRLIAESATGSMRDAESILDQVIAYSENKVTAQEVRDILGLLPHEIFYQFFDNIINHNTETALKLINKLVKEGVELNKFVQDLI